MFNTFQEFLCSKVAQDIWTFKKIITIFLKIRIHFKIFKNEIHLLR